MIRRAVLALAAVVLSACASFKPPEPRAEWAIALHGGAGVIERADMDPQTEAAYRAALANALEAGSKVLRQGGTSLDAIEAAVRLMEDDPLFNAGRGAVFTAEGRNELDASIMDGATLKAGSVAGVTTVHHPITLARAVMDRSRHVMLTGPGAERFAAEQGQELVPPSFFFTERRWKALEKELARLGLPIPKRPQGAPAPSAESLRAPLDERKFGTVGVVALDRHGNVAAGTSTGGTTAKRWGRVGDAPIIGAGTYASNRSCAVSATGTGEFFIRLTVAREICALVEYERMPLQRAADEVIQKRLTELGGDGGAIALTPSGDIAWSFNTSGMYRASASSRRAPEVAIFKDEK
ncbi:MAG TPA: isoaspartyl peptidase/L-asparaginase [Caulobacteraceae bacterium]|nr:isoaspartyl peptidase/L-asparaginase [Caulobacteraceae bacterium]